MKITVFKKVFRTVLIDQLNALSLVLDDSRAAQLISQLKISYQYKKNIEEAMS